MYETRLYKDKNTKYGTNLSRKGDMMTYTYLFSIFSISLRLKNIVLFEIKFDENVKFG